MEQVLLLTNALDSRLKGIPCEELVLLSSPKRRCIQTLQAFAVRKSCELRITDLLDEARYESRKQFFRRVARFLAFFKKSAPKVTIICSHGDWIPAALELISEDWQPDPSASGLAIRKASCTEVHWVDHRWVLKSYWEPGAT